ncbi:MAG: 3-dehydroquinate synthase [Planctomycetes bacterium]|nr:3-dehydroquinate synthase [Planctomycetota bacterium]
MLRSIMGYNNQFSVAYSFDLHSTSDVFSEDNHCLAEILHHPEDTRDARALVYVDSGVAQADPGLCERISRWFHVHQDHGVHLAAMPELIEGGEVLKNDMSIVDRVGQACLANKICRHSYIITIGGGAVLDAVGFAASIIHRGIRHIRLPSTVLAQCDAGLGVKNGINRFGNKNFYGCFAPPWAIINDSKFLEILPERSWRSGIAEAFKVSIIKDKEFASWLITHAEQLAARDLSCMETLIERSAQLHLDHICLSGDPFEQGSSRPLDFGHWSAHRLEIISKHELNHGEAVAIGVALDLCYASFINRLSHDTVSLILDALHQCGFTLWHNALELDNPPGRRSVLQGLEQFREHLGGELTLAMPDGLGQQKDIYEFDEIIFEKALQMLKDENRRLANCAQPTR